VKERQGGEGFETGAAPVYVLAVRSARGCEEKTLDLSYDGGGKERTEEFEAEFLGLDAVVE
jgi:hypothetical protein